VLVTGEVLPHDGNSGAVLDGWPPAFEGDPAWSAAVSPAPGLFGSRPNHQMPNAMINSQGHATTIATRKKDLGEDLPEVEPGSEADEIVGHDRLPTDRRHRWTLPRVTSSESKRVMCVPLSSAWFQGRGEARR
jgi:hypothetical protein